MAQGRVPSPNLCSSQSSCRELWEEAWDEERRKRRVEAYQDGYFIMDINDAMSCGKNKSWRDQSTTAIVGDRLVDLSVGILVAKRSHVREFPSSSTRTLQNVEIQVIVRRVLGGRHFILIFMTSCKLIPDCKKKFTCKE